jgi:TIR domain
MSDLMPPRELPDKFLVAFSFAGEQRNLVRRIAEAVEAHLGRSKVFFDEWYEAYIAGDGADIVLQDIYCERCHVAVVCVSERYGGKEWTLAEHAAVRDRVNRSRASDSDSDRLGVLPIRVGDGHVKGIPKFITIIPDVRTRSLDATVTLILDRLRFAAPGSHRPTAPSARPPWPNEPMPYEPGLADRAEPWPAIQELMTANAAKRILMLKGPSGHSKTALLNAAARYAKILGVPAAYVDFKDSQFLSQTNVLRRLRLDLGAVLPDFTEPDPYKLLEALRTSASPVLILLDTYEKIKETKELVDWIETQLLAEVEECKQLRFLIGGQKVPDCSQSRWRELAEEIELDEIKDQQVWIEWGKQKNPRMDDKHVEGIVLGLEGVPGTISSALTTIAKTLPRTA